MIRPPDAWMAILDDLKQLAGSDNLVWTQGRDRLAAGRSPDFVLDLDAWRTIVREKRPWHQYEHGAGWGDPASMHDGAIWVLRAWADRGMGGGAVVDLHRAASAFHRGLTGLRDASEPVEGPGVPASPGDSTPGGVSALGAELECLEAAPPLAGMAPYFGMVRSGLAWLAGGGRGGSVGGDATIGPGDLKGSITFPVLFVRSLGEVRFMTLEWFLGGNASPTFFPDPVGLGCTIFDARFREALRVAWEYAGPRFPRGSRVRWRLTLNRADRWLDSDSLGGAIAAGLVGLVEGLCFDCIGLSATISPDGSLGRVSGLDQKIKAARCASLSAVLVCHDDRNEAKQWAGTHGIKWMAAETVASAISLMEGEVGPLVAPKGYLRRLAEWFARCPWLRNGLWEDGLFNRDVGPFFGRRVVVHDEYVSGSEHGGRTGGPPSVMKWEEAIQSRGPWLVLTSGPGLGKTTLLLHEGWRTASEAAEGLLQGDVWLKTFFLPIYLTPGSVLGADKALKDWSLKDSLVEVALARGESDDPALRAIISEKVESGRVLLLVDNVTNRLRHRQVLEALAAYASRTGARVILATRQHESRNRAIEWAFGTLPVLDLVPSTDDDVRHFVKQYFRYLRQSERFEEVLGRIQQGGNADDLMHIPLFLAMLCDLAESRGLGELPNLPPGRFHLYRLCFEGFLLKGAPYLDNVVRERQRQLFFALAVDFAWELFRDDPSRVGYTAQQMAEALDRCRRSLEALEWDRDTALTRLTEHERLMIGSRSVLTGSYMMLHRTFQEYLLAEALGQRDPGLDDTVSAAKLYDAMWSEVLTLLGGVLAVRVRSGGASPRVYFERLVQADAEDLLHRPLLLAAQAAAEADGGPGGLCEDLARLLIDLDNEPGVTSFELTVPTLGRMGPTARRALNHSPGPAARLILIRLDGRGHERQKRDSADLVRWRERLIEVRVPAERAELVRKLSEVDPEDCKSAVTALGRMLSVGTLESSLVREAAVLALEDLGTADPALLAEVLSQLMRAAGDLLPQIRCKVAASLGRLGTGDAKSVETLVVLLGDKDVLVRIFAAEALGRAGGSNPGAATALRAVLDTTHEQLRLTAAVALARLGVAATDVLFPFLGSRSEVDRRAAIEALAWAGAQAKRPVSPDGAPASVREDHARVLSRFAGLVETACRRLGW